MHLLHLLDRIVPIDQVLLRPRLLRWRNLFLLFYMCHSTMSLTRCHKTAPFYTDHIICSLSIFFFVVKTHGRHIWIPSLLDHRRRNCDVKSRYQFLKMAATAQKSTYGCLPVSWCLTFKKIKSHLHTKCRKDVSIHGGDITTSGFWQQTTAILKFYFRFQLWPLHCDSASDFIWIGPYSS